MEKNFLELRKKNLELRKVFQNRKKYFKIEKNISELRNILLQVLRKKLWN